MKIETRIHRFGKGWSAPLPVESDGAATLVLAMCDPDAGHCAPALAELKAALPQAVIVGCSSSGPVLGELVHDESVVAAVARFEHSTLRATGTDLAGAADSADAGARIAAALAGEGLRAVLVFSDGLAVDGTALAEGLCRGLPAGVAVVGGLAGDGSRFASTWVVEDGATRTGRVCAVGLYGESLVVGHAFGTGWTGFGPERTITRSRDNVLTELDGRSALGLYKHYLGERAGDLPASALLFPLTVRRGPQDATTRVRTVLSVDEAEQSMTFAGDIPEGGSARLMRTTTDALVRSAESAAAQACAALPDDADALLLSVSWVGRRLVLGQRVDEETETVATAAGPRRTHVGFYSYGELCPRAPGRPTELHNQTMTVCAIAERL